MARKTHSVAKFQQTINHALDNPGLTQDEKRVLCIVLEKVLHETGNYDGFGYAGGYDPKNQYNRHYYVARAISAEYRKLDEEYNR
jgi:hypothetical protein